MSFQKSKFCLLGKGFTTSCTNALSLEIGRTSDGNGTVPDSGMTPSLNLVFASKYDEAPMIGEPGDVGAVEYPDEKLGLNDPGGV